MKLSTTLLSILVPSLLVGSTTTNETSFGGDFSSNWLAPTGLSFTTDSNQVFGTLIRTSTTTPDDKDYFTFTVPTGNQIIAINVLPGTIAGGGGGVSFIGIAAGSTVIDPNTTPNSALAAGLLGYTLYGAGDIGKSILPRMASSNSIVPAAQGFSVLGPGTYTIWIQEGATGTFPYGFDIVIGTPEPATVMLMAASLALIALSRRRL